MLPANRFYTTHEYLLPSATAARRAIFLGDHQKTFNGKPKVMLCAQVVPGAPLYMATLDGWRAIAILVVMFGHLSVGVGLGGFREIGGLGVEIFFGISGFLITTLLLREERANGRISLRGFYRRRAFRILPAASVYLAAIGVLVAAGEIPMTYSRWLSAMFFAANYSSAPTSWYVGHFWSLAVEEHFYVAWPAFLYAVRQTRARLVISISAALAIAIWRAIDFTYRLTWSDNAYFVGRTDINADAILFGAAFAVALADDRLGPMVRRAVSHRLALLSTLAIFMLTFVIQADPALRLPLLTVRAVAVPVMILATVNRPRDGLAQMLEWAPLRYIGLMSYSLYLWQQLFLTWEPAPGLNAVQWFPANLIASCFCAFVSYRLIERPMINAGRGAGPRVRGHQTVFGPVQPSDLRSATTSHT